MSNNYMYCTHFERCYRLYTYKDGFVSSVYNWTVEEVTDWLDRHVELSQYIATFKSAKIDGTMLPR